MNLFQNWEEELTPVIEKYKNKKHPLEYHNQYQLLIMVILSTQDSDININAISKIFFKKYPTLNCIASSSIEEISSHLSSVKNNIIKAHWIFENALALKEAKAIPIEMQELIKLKGVGRKSANVIIRELHINAKGIIVDLHVIRVVSRIGLVPSLKDGNKIEKLLMNILPESIWGDIGMSLSFLGREICRPTNPKCVICPINNTCNHYKISVV